MKFSHKLEIKLREQFISIWDDSVTTWADCLVLAKVFHPFHHWTWYIISQDPEDTDYLWVIVDGEEVEVGSFHRPDFDLKIQGLPMEFDCFFEPVIAKELYSQLLDARKND